MSAPTPPDGAPAPDPATDRPQPAPTGTWAPATGDVTRLVLLRHGVTEATLARRYAGSSDLPLVEQGLAQAAAAATRMPALGIDVVVASPLTRTRQTAQACADLLGLPVQVEPGFAETDFGSWEGLTFAEVRAGWPDELAAWLADPALAPPGGESFVQVTERVAAARDAVLARHPGRTVLVVSHVTPIKTLVRLALDAPFATLHRMHLNPASLSAVQYYADGNVSMTLFNDTAHLPTG